MARLPIVLDNGTGSIKCGCADVSPLPLLVCPTVTGKPKVGARILYSAHRHGNISDEANIYRAQLLQREFLCGDELEGLRKMTELTYPIKNGVLHDMEAMQVLWNYVLCTRLPQLVDTSMKGATTALQRTKREGMRDDLDCGHEWLEGHPLLLTEPPNLSTKQRYDMMEVLFEDYHFGSIQSTPQGVLSLFANGAECGVAVECGEGLTHCTPVFDGFVLPTAQRRVDLGGRAVTELLKRLLCEQQGGLPGSMMGKRDILTSSSVFSTASRGAAMRDRDDEVFRRLKERYCYVPVDQSLDRRLARDTNALQRTCILPDGTKCRLGAERFAAPEVLFDPSLVDVESPGISMVLWNCIEAADVDVRKSLYANIILSGGSTLLPGFGARLTRDMREFYFTEKMKGDVGRMGQCPILVKEPPRRQYMAYIGGALVAKVSADQPEMWMSRKEYEEGGRSAIVARYPTGV